MSALSAVRDVDVAAGALVSFHLGRAQHALHENVRAQVDPSERASKPADSHNQALCLLGGSRLAGCERRIEGALVRDNFFTDSNGVSLHLLENRSRLLPLRFAQSELDGELPLASTRPEACKGLRKKEKSQI